jgi:23S rRNA (guanine745-N1)-methyltransferase
VTTRAELPPAAVALLACPVCGGGLAGVDDGAGLRCPGGHSFDRARQGHVTLLPPGHRPPSGDSAEMVADRAAFLDGGHYAGVGEALADAVLAGAPPATVLDLGGGTGHHLARVLDRAPGAVGVVLDSSRYAARRAARAHPRALAVVADSWARWPVRDAVLDRVLVVFAPRNGAETARVLRPGGRLVVVTPAPDHLAELIGPLGLLRVDPDKAERLVASLEPHLEPVAATGHRERLRLDRSAVATLVGMGPHARHLSRDRIAAGLAALPEPVDVTVAVAITAYQRPHTGHGAPPERGRGAEESPSKLPP